MPLQQGSLYSFIDPAPQSVIELLQACALPTADLGVSGKVGFVCEYRGGELVATCGLEVLGTTAPLRSLAVRADWRGQGLAANLLNAVLQSATARGIGEVYLLTETASDFFIRHGFTVIDRDLAPDAIRTSSQFASLCPQSAALLMIKLNNID